MRSVALLPQEFLTQSCFFHSLALHDPSFVTPVLVMLLNFALLKTSRHPLLIHLNNPNNFFSCFNFAFMGGLLFVPVPCSYTMCYLGLGLGHLLIRAFRHTAWDVKKKFTFGKK